MKDQHGKRSSRGPVPKALADGAFRVYTWDVSSFGKRVELAAIDADKKCLRHHAKGCWKCKFLLRYW